MSAPIFLSLEDSYLLLNVAEGVHRLTSDRGREGRRGGCNAIGFFGNTTAGISDGRAAPLFLCCGFLSIQTAAGRSNPSRREGGRLYAALWLNREISARSRGRAAHLF